MALRATLTDENRLRAGRPRSQERSFPLPFALCPLPCYFRRRSVPVAARADQLPVAPVLGVIGPRRTGGYGARPLHVDDLNRTPFL